MMIGVRGHPEGSKSRSDIMRDQLLQLAKQYGISNEELSSTAEMAGGGPASTPPIAPRQIGVPRRVQEVKIGTSAQEQIALNEYTENNKILLGSFPYLFCLGKGVPGMKQAPERWVRHANRQYRYMLNVVT